MFILISSWSTCVRLLICSLELRLTNSRMLQARSHAFPKVLRVWFPVPGSGGPCSIALNFLGVVWASEKKNSELGLWANLGRSEWRPVHKEPRKTRKHRFPECFLGAQTCGKQCFLARQTKKPFTEKQTFAHAHFRKYSLRDATAESSQHCFLDEQTGKHLLRKQNVSEKNRKHFLFLGNKKCFRNKCFVHTQTNI